MAFERVGMGVCMATNSSFGSDGVGCGEESKEGAKFSSVREEWGREGEAAVSLKIEIINKVFG